MLPAHKLSIAVAMALSLTCAGTLATHAQTKAGPAYLVVEISVKDEDGFNEYAEKATRTVEQYGGKFIVLGATAKAIEGPEPNGASVIIKFDSVKDAESWLNSPEYSAVKGIRHRTADARQYLVEGLPEQ